jgi:hypothetical protein
LPKYTNDYPICNFVTRSLQELELPDFLFGRTPRKEVREPGYPGPRT